MKRLFFITSTLTSGGSERVMSLLANELADRGYRVTIICLNKQIVFYPINENVTIIFAEKETHSSFLFNKITWLRKYVDDRKPDVVIPFMEAVYCVTLLSLIGVPVPVISSERIDPRKSPFIRNILRRIFLPLTTHLVVQTEKIKNFYPSFIRKKTSVIYNPVNDEVFHQIENGELKIENEGRLNRIVSIGKLYPQKNQEMMIRAFAKIADGFPDWQLVIFGEGPLRKSLEMMVESLEVQGRVLLPGRTEHVLEELRKSKIFCFSSNFEGMSNAIIEAICMGLPIVTTDVSGVSELIEEGKGGYVVPCGDVDQFAQALQKVMSDNNIQELMSDYNLKKADIFKLDTIVDQWEQLIKKVVQGSK